MKQTFFASWLKPPRLRSAETQESGEERHASWFELFFDLVFVLAIAQLSYSLQQDISFSGFARFAGLFVPVWWAWVIYVFYADRFDTDDVIYRGMVMVGMFAIGAMSTSLSAVYSEDGAVAFVLAYLIVRLVPLLLYIRAARQVELGRKLSVRYGTGTLLGAIFWLSSLPVPTPGRYLLWAVAVVIEVATPFAARRVVSRTPMDVAHIAERFGLFTIIVLGELVVTVGSGLSQSHWQLAKMVAASTAFVIACGLWWIYFEFGEAPPIQRRFWPTQVFVFGHLAIALALTMVAAASKLAIDQVNQQYLSVGVQWVLAGGTALYLLVITLIRLVLYSRQLNLVYALRIISAGVILALAAVGPVMPPLYFLGLLALIMAFQVLFKLVWMGWKIRTDPKFREHLAHHVTQRKKQALAEPELGKE